VALPVGFVAGLLVWWGQRIIGSGVGFVWDDLAYHAVLPAWWIQHSSLALPPFGYQGYFPANAELFALWFMLPFGSDALGNLSVLFWMVLILLSCAVITRELGHSPLVTSAAIACLLLSPEIAFFAGTFSGTDLAVAGLCLATLALAGRPEAHVGTARAALSGLAGGLALGTKITTAPLILLVGIWWIYRVRMRAGDWGHVAAYGLGVISLGFAWYLRNLAISGNPLFPAAIGPFDGPFSIEAQQKTTLVPSILAGWTQPAFWAEFTGRRLDWPLPLGLVALAGYVAGTVALLRERERPRRLYYLLLLGTGGLFLLLFPFQPFAGTNNRPASGLHHLIRYLAFPFALGLVLFPSAVAERHSGAALFRTAAAGLAAASTGVTALVGSAWGLGGVLVARVGARLLRGRSLPVRAVVPLAVLLAWGAVTLATPHAEKATAERLYSFGNGRPVGSGWRALEQLPAGSRVAVQSHDPSTHALYHPLFGRRLQLRPVAVLPSGEARPPLHESWRGDPDGWWWEFDELDRPVDPERLLGNLDAAGVDYLLVNKWPRDNRDPHTRWPRVRAALLEALGPERRAYQDPYSEVWDLGPGTVEERGRRTFASDEDSGVPLTRDERPSPEASRVPDLVPE
jgi:hypothetical protein